MTFMIVLYQSKTNNLRSQKPTKYLFLLFMQRKPERERERERERKRGGGRKREGYGKCLKRTTAATIEETISHQNDGSDFDTLKNKLFKIFTYVPSRYKTSNCLAIEI